MLDLLTTDRCLTNLLKHIEICAVSGCWCWKGGRSRGGQRPQSGPYGTFNIPGRRGGVRAHVVVACLFGIIDNLRVPPGFNIDHICENTLCVNPFHLELITKEENNARQHRERRNLTYADRWQLRGIVPLSKEMERWLS